MNESPIRAERDLLDAGGVFVSTARVVVGPTTYPVRAITSVSYATIPGKRLGAMLCLVLGVGGIGSGSYAFGATLLAVGALCWWAFGERYALRLVTASGRVDAIVSRDRRLIEQAVAAVNEAIVQRG